MICYINTKAFVKNKYHPWDGLISLILVNGYFFIHLNFEVTYPNGLPAAVINALVGKWGAVNLIAIDYTVGKVP